MLTVRNVECLCAVLNRRIWNQLIDFLIQANLSHIFPRRYASNHSFGEGGLIFSPDCASSASFCPHRLIHLQTIPQALYCPGLGAHWSLPQNFSKKFGLSQGCHQSETQTTQDCQSYLATHKGQQVSGDTVRQSLKRSGVFNYVKQRKMALTAEQMAQRVEWRRWTALERSRTVFSDEKTFGQDCTGQKQRVWLPRKASLFGRRLLLSHPSEVCLGRHNRPWFSRMCILWRRPRCTLLYQNIEEAPHSQHA